MNTLELDSVNLSFTGRSVLSNVYLKCQSGDIVGLLGRNGCGKSSLLKILFGSLKPQNHSVRLNGKYITQLLSVSGAVSYLPQDGFAMGYLTFNDLIAIFQLKSRLDQIFKIDEIRQNAHRKLDELPDGLIKIMETMSVLYSNSSFVLLDEPFSYLSPLLVEKIIPHIRYQSGSKGIILTDHQYENVLLTGNRFYLISDGTLKTIEGKEQLISYGYLP